MKKYYCDRCGEEIKDVPLKMFPETNEGRMHKKLELLMAPLISKDFCNECMAEIVEFSLNKQSCDECVQQMMDENVMLRETDEKVGSDTRRETDPDEIDWNNGLNRMERFNRLGESPC